MFSAGVRSVSAEGLYGNQSPCGVSSPVSRMGGGGGAIHVVCSSSALPRHKLEFLSCIRRVTRRSPRVHFSSLRWLLNSAVPAAESLGLAPEIVSQLVGRCALSAPPQYTRVYAYGIRCRYHLQRELPRKQPAADWRRTSSLSTGPAIEDPEGTADILRNITLCIIWPLSRSRSSSAPCIFRSRSRNPGCEVSRDPRRRRAFINGETSRREQIAVPILIKPSALSGIPVRPGRLTRLAGESEKRMCELQQQRGRKGLTPPNAQGGGAGTSARNCSYAPRDERAPATTSSDAARKTTPWFDHCFLDNNFRGD